MVYKNTPSFKGSSSQRKIKTTVKKVLEGSTAEKNALIAYRILKQKESDNTENDDPKRDIVLVNAAAAIYLAGKARTLNEGIEIARESIGSGAAFEKLRSLIEYSGGNLTKLEELDKNR